MLHASCLHAPNFSLHDYAAIGDKYDAQRDAFISPQPYPSWQLNEDTCLWEAPSPMPTDGLYGWNEETVSWVRMDS